MDHAGGRQYTVETLETMAGDCVSVRTPEGNVIVESGDAARLHASSRASFSVTTWREDTTLHAAVERDEDSDPVDVELELPDDRRVGAVSTGAGDVLVQNVDGAPAVETATGDIRISETTGVESMWTGDGDVHVSVDTLPSDATVETAAGDVTLGLADSLDATVEVQVRDGEVDGSFGVFDDVTERATEYVQGVLGDGGAWLTAKSGNGDGTVERA